MNELKLTFGERLTDLRKEAGLSQHELGVAVGFTAATIGNYEGDKSFPDKSTLVKLADILCVSIDYLLCRTDERLGWKVENGEITEGVTANDLIASVVGLNEYSIKLVVDFVELLKRHQ